MTGLAEGPTPGDAAPQALRRRLGIAGTTLSGLGIILGAGVYVLIGEAAADAGSALWLSFVLAAVLAAATGLSYAELASMFPEAAPAPPTCERRSAGGPASSSAGCCWR